MLVPEPRRLVPRVRVDGLCGVVLGTELRPATMCDLSWIGVRLELPFDPSAAVREVQLEIEVPEIDEIMWACGHVTFAKLTPMGGLTMAGQPRFWCSAGVRLDAAASRDRRLLRDYTLAVRAA